MASLFGTGANVHAPVTLGRISREENDAGTEAVDLPRGIRRLTLGIRAEPAAFRFLP